MAAGALKKNKVWRSPELNEEKGRIGHWYVLSSSRGEPTADVIFLEPIMVREAVETAKSEAKAERISVARRKLRLK